MAFDTAPKRNQFPNPDRWFSLLKPPELWTPELKNPEFKTPEFAIPTVWAPVFPKPAAMTVPTAFCRPELLLPPFWNPELPTPVLKKPELLCRRCRNPSSGRSRCRRRRTRC